MIDATIMGGFTKITETIRKAVGKGIKDPFDLGVYVHIKMEANWSTGIYDGTALHIAYKFGNHKLNKKIQRSMFRLRKARLINYQVQAGARGAYRVLVDGFEVTLGGLKGQCLNAWTHGSKAQPDYEVAGCSRADNGLSTGAERADDGPTQDIPRFSLDVSKFDEDEAIAIAVAPLHPQSGEKPETTKDNIRSICSVNENELTECISLWIEILDSSPDEDDFRELLSDRNFICSLEQNQITLSFLFTWSQLVSTDFKGMKSSRDFRLEANSVLTRFVNYVKTSSPRKVRERVRKYLERLRKKKFAESRQPQIQQAWQNTMGTELDFYVCARLSYQFDYSIEQFQQAFESLAIGKSLNFSDHEDQVAQVIKAVSGDQQVVEDDDDVEDWVVP